MISGRIRHRGWSSTFDNPEFQRDDGSALLHAGRIVPVYRLTAGADRGAPPSRDPRRAGPARRISRVPARGDPRGRGADRRSVTRSSRRTTRRHSKAATQRCAGSPSTSCSRSSWAWSRGDGSARGPARRRCRSTTPTDAEVRATLEAGIGARAGREVQLTDDQVAAIADVRRDLAGEVPMLRLLQGDVGSGKTAVAAYAMAGIARLGLAVGAARPDRPARAPARRDRRRPARAARRPPDAADGLAQRAGHGLGARAHRIGPGGRRRRDPRTAPGARRVLEPRPRRRRRAASVRRRATGRPRAQGPRRGRPARAAHDGDPDPAHARPGAVRGPRRVGPADAAVRPSPDPDRDPAPRRARGRLGRRCARRPRPGIGRSWSCRWSRRATTRREPRRQRPRRRSSSGWARCSRRYASASCTAA